MFWKKKTDNSAGIVLITNLQIDVRVLESRLKQLELDFEVLRNFVKEKIKKTAKPKEETEDIYNGVLLPFDGTTKRY